MNCQKVVIYVPFSFLNKPCSYIYQGEMVQSVKCPLESMKNQVGSPGTHIKTTDSKLSTVAHVVMVALRGQRRAEPWSYGLVNG